MEYNYIERGRMKVRQKEVIIKGPLEKAIHSIVAVSDPDRIILFGSRARDGDNCKGDFDLFVLKKGMRDPRKVAQQIYLAFEDIGAPVDVLAEDADRFERLKEDPYLIYREIATEGQVVYEKH